MVIKNNANQDKDFQNEGALFIYLFIYLLIFGPWFLIDELPQCPIFVNWNVNMVTIYKVFVITIMG